MKHAYLIMTHGNFKVLKLLLRLIDDERNDIYIHIDKKCGEVNIVQFTDVIKKSNVYFVERHKGGWGWILDIEYELFEQAYKKKYSYYHLISGVDLPIKSQNYIHGFFEQNYGKLFVGFKEDYLFDYDRIERIHLFPQYYRTKNIFIRYLRSVFLLVQKKIGYKYRKSTEDFVFKKGPTWVSITHEFVGYLINNKNKVTNLYKFSFSSDEQFIQTLLYNSEFRPYIYDYVDQLHSCMRYVNWKKGTKEYNAGSPSAITLADAREIVKTDRLFARKFSEEHWDAIEFIEQFVKE